MLNEWILSACFLVQATQPAITTPAKASLTLESYLQQVESSHQGFLAAKLRSQGAQLQAREKTLFYSPQLFSSYSFLDDEKPTGSTLLGDQTKAHSFNLGIQQNTFFGMQGRAYYQLNHVEISGANPMYIPQPSYYEGRPVLELSQPLWRNFLGRETRATAEILKSQALAESFANRFQVKMLEVEAKVRYFKLMLMRSAIGIRKSALDQSKDLRVWADRRSKLELADRSDSLQASSAFQARNIEYEKAVQDAREAERSLNSFRGVATSEVSEDLPELGEENFMKLAIPPRDERREDALAAREKARVDSAAAKLLQEKYRPALNLKGSFAGNGRDPQYGTTTSDSLSTDHPTWSVGVDLTMPLNIFAAHDVDQAGKLKAEATQADVARKYFDEDRDYESLVERFQDSKALLKLAFALEKLQQDKVDHEHERLKRGRTTTFQVLTFEQDFNSSQLNRIQLSLEILSILAQLQTYSASR